MIQGDLNLLGGNWNVITVGILSSELLEGARAFFVSVSDPLIHVRFGLSSDTVLSVSSDLTTVI